MPEVHRLENAAPAKVVLEDGTEVYRSSAWAPPGCHGVGCGLRVFVKDGELIKVEGDPDQPITKGRLCARCLALKDFHYHKDRLRSPMKRARKERGNFGAWEKCSWDEAYDIIEREFKRVKAEYGPNSIGVFAGTGREGGRYHYAMSLDVFRTVNTIESISGWSCIIPRMAAMLWEIGVPYLDIDNAIGLPKRYDDPRWEPPKYALIWGCDPIRSNPAGFWGHSLIELMKMGTKIINVDPRMNWLSIRSEINFQIRPGTDGALALALLNEVIKTDLYDKDFVEKWCYGFDELAERASEWPAERAAEICEVDADDIRLAAKCLTERPCTLEMGLAVDQNPNGVQVAQAVLSIFAICNQLDIPGGVMLGEPEKMFEGLQGEIGGDGHHVDDPYPLVNEPEIGWDKFPALPLACNTPHPDEILNALEGSRPEKIDFVYMLNTNILACMPAQPKRWYEAIRNKVGFVCCADLFMTPTINAFADLVLPVSDALERDGIVSNNMASMHGQLGALTAPLKRIGDTKSDLEIAIDLFHRLHPDDKNPKWVDVNSYLSADLRAIQGCDMDYPEFKNEVFTQLDFGYEKYKTGELRADGSIGFGTPSGRIELWCSAIAGVGQDPLPYYIEPPMGPVSRPDLYKDYPFIMITGARHFGLFHSENRQVNKLRETHPWPTVQINPKPAKELGIEDGQWVYLENPWGKVKMKAKVTPIVKENVIAADHGWWYPEGDPDDLYGVWEANVNSLMPHGVVGPLGFGAPYKSSLPAKIYPAN